MKRNLKDDVFNQQVGYAVHPLQLNLFQIEFLDEILKNKSYNWRGVMILSIVKTLPLFNFCLLYKVSFIV